MTYEEITAGFRALQASDFDYKNINARGWERLAELTDALMTVSTSGGVESGPMAIPGALTRKRGNPDWGHPPRPVPALPTEFEVRVSQLQLSPERYTSSAELRAWCERNRNRCYVPEWLLKEWDITVDPSSAA